ncbi:MAG: EAL domain-containing protein [Arcobacteraceae bacterium]|jgi:EAL domain-containing protein (putative c-di-GMP-specific phosphodiesterase class I)|nr:EAL domain-containing protein [Arcobacteraceae bacterium]
MRELIIEAIENNQIIPYYQMIKCNATTTKKYECLARLKVKGRILTPIHFLKIAKEENLSDCITKQMVTKSFEYFYNRSCSFSINISFKDIVNDKTRAFILTALDNFHLPQNVIFEILEDESIELLENDNNFFIEFITELKVRGCKIAIDDFGSGYSNFMNLLKMEVDILKIDGSMIKKIESKNVRLVIEAIVSMAQKLNIQTVAEFVETEDIQTVVKAIGINHSQGYLYSKPSENVECFECTKPCSAYKKYLVS